MASLTVREHSAPVEDVESSGRNQTGGLDQRDEDERRGHRDVGLEDLASEWFQYLVACMERDLKPYFEHLDTKTFLKRCVRSVLPATKYDDLLTHPDFYAPLVLTFALSSCLHFALKKADPAPLDRHLGTSLLVCFGSLVVGSLALDVAWQYSSTMARQSPAKFGLDRAWCLVGYSFFGPCIVILLDGRLWTWLFIIIATVVEVGTALSFGTAAFRASYSQNHVLGVACAILHVIWLYNLRSLLKTFDSVVVDIAG